MVDRDFFREWREYLIDLGYSEYPLDEEEREQWFGEYHGGFYKYTFNGEIKSWFQLLVIEGNPTVNFGINGPSWDYRQYFRDISGGVEKTLENMSLELWKKHSGV